MRDAIIALVVLAMFSTYAFASKDQFPREVVSALSEIDNSDLYSKKIPAKNQEIRADYMVLEATSTGTIYYDVLYWNTTTGASRLYKYNADEKKFIPYRDAVQLPENPLGFDPEGKVMADYNATYAVHEDKAYYEVLFWDTKTGRSNLYFYNSLLKVFEAYQSNVQFPEAPLGEVEGEVMATYSMLYATSESKVFYEGFFWDTETGKSKLYYYSFSSKSFKAYEDKVQIPEDPLGFVPQGRVMADYNAVHVPSEDKTYFEVIVWDTKTGQSVLYYYNYTDGKFVRYEDKVQFPERPLGKDAEGEIIVDYEAAHDPAANKTYYEGFFYDTQSGESKLYWYYDGSFHPYEDKVQLPVPSIADGKNDLHVKYVSNYFHSTGNTLYEVFFINSKTGESRLFYYDGEESKFLEYKDETLPSKPLGS